MLKTSIVLAQAFLACACQALCIEDSVIPLMESLERLETIKPEKYSHNMFKEIEAVLSDKEERIRLATYNTLYNLRDENYAIEYRWPQRKSRVIAMIEEIDADILGVQEVYPSQLEDLCVALNQKYSFYGVPEADGENNGIFYKKSRFKLVNSQSWPLGDKTAVLNMAHLEDHYTHKQIIFFNVHLSCANINKRDMEARLIHNIIGEFVAKNKISIVLTGDMNTFPHRTDMQGLPYHDGEYVQNILKGDIMANTMDISLLGHVGPIATFTNKDPEAIKFQGYGTPGVILDHIYVTKNVQVLVHGINPGKADGLFPSDHMPVIADIVLK